MHACTACDGFGAARCRSRAIPVEVTPPPRARRRPYGCAFACWYTCRCRRRYRTAARALAPLLDDAAVGVWVLLKASGLGELIQPMFRSAAAVHSQWSSGAGAGAAVGTGGRSPAPFVDKIFDVIKVVVGDSVRQARASHDARVIESAAALCQVYLSQVPLDCPLLALAALLTTPGACTGWPLVLILLRVAWPRLPVGLAQQRALPAVGWRGPIPDPRHGSP